MPDASDNAAVVSTPDSNGGLSPDPPIGLRLDAVLLTSFGGPEGPADVMPFLRHATAGRGVPPERLLEVAGQYAEFGGVSPINAQNRQLRSSLEGSLARRGLDLTVYIGNRNWHPFLRDAIAELAALGARDIAVLITSGFASYSSCRQYREQIYLASRGQTNTSRLRFHKIRSWFDHPVFLDLVAEKVVQAFGESQPGPQRDRLLFTTHSLPLSMATSSGIGNQCLYVAQHEFAAKAVATRVSRLIGFCPEAEVVFQSRSGSPRTPWLEPDINIRIRELSAAGVKKVVVVPLGFITDHMEVRWDLDIKARRTAAESGLEFIRADTVGSDPRFAALLADLVSERAFGTPGEQRPAEGPGGPGPDRCAANCCPGSDPDRPTVC